MALSSEAQAPPDVDVAEGPSAPFMHIVGLALACLLGVALWVRLEGNPFASAPRSTVVEPAVVEADPTPAPAGVAVPASPAPLMQPYDPAVPDREPLAGLPGALERFGGAFPIRHPAYLPADLAPFTVNWQPDADPARRAAGVGELLSWFYSAEHGAVLVLAQGPGVGIWPLTARDGRAGRLRLADGTEVIWVVGHPTTVGVPPTLEPTWAGTEITIGVAPSAGPGWYLRSPIISLPELLRVAESLREAGSRE